MTTTTNKIQSPPTKSEECKFKGYPGHLCKLCQKQDQPQESQNPKIWNTPCPLCKDKFNKIHGLRIHLTRTHGQKQDQPAEWEERFGQVWGGYHASEDTRGLDARIKDFIRSELSRQKQNLIRDIKNWSKGKNVTKDGLRHYLNTLKGDSR